MNPTDTSPAPVLASQIQPGSWRDLLSPAHAPVVTVLASGVGLYAMNLYFTAALLPTVVADIGGARYYAWTATAYLITAVIATMLVGRLLALAGSAKMYALAFSIFALGTSICALSPAMEYLVGGRAVQGFGAGMLSGLGYAAIRSTLPERLWVRATGVISAMFGVGALLGPVLGGGFAELGQWRLGFGVLSVCGLLLILVALRSLPSAPARLSEPAPIPVLPMVTLAAAAAALSVSAMLAGVLMWIAIGSGLLLLALFLVCDARHPHGVLPRLTYTRGNPLKWVYLTVAVFCAGVMSENFIPLFAQQVGGVSPMLAGIIGAALSLGWVGTQLFSVNASGSAARRLVRLAPWLLTAGLAAYGLLQMVNPGPWVVVAWASVLFIAGGGIGLAFPHLSVAAMRSTADEREGAKAAAAVSTTQLIAFTLTSALAGNLLLLGADPVGSARWLILGIAALTVCGIATEIAATRPRR
ncbi:MFS transporter [Leucobacter luti]|uniref:MFS transporter n=1 Tax=Leucobacter luti TaxID=340320 RepID=UPI0010E4588C|nr:MFS transporter [Leucobacter luti]MCW2288651.1 MFS family permease [Leucobacter luti]TCK45193.1 MFS transporter [Leucobacter luti]